MVLLGVVEGVLAGGVSLALGALVAGEVEILWLGLLFPLDFGKGVVGRLGTPPLDMGMLIWLGPNIGILPGLIPGLMPCLKGGPFGNILGPLGPIFGPLGPMLGPLGPMFGPLGPILGPLGPILGPLGPIFGPFGPMFGPMGPILGI